MPSDTTDFKLGDIVETVKGARFWGEIIAFDNDGKNAGCTVLATAPGFEGTKHVYPLAQLQRPAWTDVPDALPAHAEPVAAKALEWREVGSGRLVAWAIGIRYTINSVFSVSVLDASTLMFLERFENVEAAKAAAQADYERRIRSALVASPAPVDAGGEGLRWGAYWYGSAPNKGANIWTVDIHGMKADLILHVGPNAADLDLARNICDLHNVALARPDTARPSGDGWRTMAEVLDAEEASLREYRDVSCQGDDTVKRHAWTVADGRLSEVGVLRRKFIEAGILPTPPSSGEGR